VTVVGIRTRWKPNEEMKSDVEWEAFLTTLWFTSQEWTNHIYARWQKQFEDIWRNNLISFCTLSLNYEEIELYLISCTAHNICIDIYSYCVVSALIDVSYTPMQLIQFEENSELLNFLILFFENFTFQWKCYILCIFLILTLFWTTESVYDNSSRTE
jgi:hypothetical protein